MYSLLDCLKEEEHSNFSKPVIGTGGLLCVRNGFGWEIDFRAGDPERRLEYEDTLGFRV